MQTLQAKIRMGNGETSTKLTQHVAKKPVGPAPTKVKASKIRMGNGEAPARVIRHIVR